MIFGFSPRVANGPSALLEDWRRSNRILPSKVMQQTRSCFRPLRSAGQGSSSRGSVADPSNVSFPRVLTGLAPLALTACSSAPSLELFGAYFPVWMLCLIVGVAGAILMRAALVATGLVYTVPLQLLVCVAAGVIVGGVFSWFWIGL